MTLREAIAMLRVHRLVETRRGRNGGTFVKRSREGPPAGPDLERLQTISVGTLRDIADEQLAISATAARLAAERATSQSKRTILGFVDQLAAARQRGTKLRADSRFHVEIAIATRSERLLRREVALQSETAGLLWLPHLSPTDEAAIITEHHEIATAIAAEDATTAQIAAEKHVRANLRRITSARLARAEVEASK
jgi:GntR family transcriptional repressor for pyruvate dehydrogenase complex